VNAWRNLKLELQREAEEIFYISGEVIVVTSDDDTDTKLIVVSRTNSLKITYVVDKDVIRWETQREYAFERIPEPAGSLAKTLITKVRR